MVRNGLGTIGMMGKFSLTAKAEKQNRYPAELLLAPFLKIIIPCSLFFKLSNLQGNNSMIRTKLFGNFLNSHNNLCIVNHKAYNRIGDGTPIFKSWRTQGKHLLPSLFFAWVHNQSPRWAKIHPPRQSSPIKVRAKILSHPHRLKIGVCEIDHQSRLIAF